MTFDRAKFTIKVQGGREYLTAAGRIVWFREAHPDWTIDTKAITVDFDNRTAFFQARILDDNGRLIATAHKYEAKFADFAGKAETGAIARALALCGYGTDASDDLDETDGREGPRYADSPQAAREEDHPRPARPQPAQAARTYQENGATGGTPAPERPAPAPRSFDPQAQISDADARVACIAMFQEFSPKVKGEWLEYLKREFSAPALGKVPDDLIGQVYRDMAAAVAEAASPARP